MVLWVYPDLYVVPIDCLRLFYGENIHGTNSNEPTSPQNELESIWFEFNGGKDQINI